jgi:hypothetical protein
VQHTKNTLYEKNKNHKFPKDQIIMLELIQQESSHTIGSNNEPQAVASNSPASPTVRRYLHDHPKVKLVVIMMLFTSFLSLITVLLPLVLNSQHKE